MENTLRLAMYFCSRNTAVVITIAMMEIAAAMPSLEPISERNSL